MERAQIVIQEAIAVLLENNWRGDLRDDLSDVIEYIAELVKDRERLDWLEQSGINASPCRKGGLIAGWFPPDKYPAHPNDLCDTIRQAIDAAREGE